VRRWTTNEGVHLLLAIGLAALAVAVVVLWVRVG
jgi:hypothetical protein